MILLKHKRTSNPNKQPQYSTNKTRTRDWKIKKIRDPSFHEHKILLFINKAHLLLVGYAGERETDKPNIFAEYEMKVQPVVNSTINSHQ
jgi:hypothetical protein